MAGVKFNKDSPEWKMFTEYWAIVQKNYLPEDSENYWENVINDLNIFILNYQGRFARELAKALQNYLELKYREGKENG